MSEPKGMAGENGTTYSDVGDLDPKIAHHGAYIKETKTLLHEYVTSGSYQDLKRLVTENNILQKKTSEYRTNILREIARRYIPDKDGFERTALMDLIAKDLQKELTDWCLYYEFSQDPFIYFLTTNFLYPKFEEGALAVRAQEVRDFLESLKADHPELGNRTDSTLNEASTKYLTALRNFGLLEGVQRKEFDDFYVPDRAIAYVVYRLIDKGSTAAKEILKHDDWKLFLMDEDEARRRVRAISPEYLTYEKRGSTERINSEFKSTRSLTDAF